MKGLLFSVLLSTFSLIGFSQTNEQPSVASSNENVHEIITLTKQAESGKYGLTGESPVKVGKGPKSGPANQRAYLELLRDGQGEPVEYKRVGSCCAYKSENGFGGYALVDRYEVVYKDKEGSKKKTILYISFYDYEEPMIPVGFSAVASN